MLPLEDERTQAYAEVFTRVLENLRRLLATDNDVLLFTSSMTGAFEGALQNLLSSGDGVLVVSNGAFGERWAAMAEAYGLKVTAVRHEWGHPWDLERIAAAASDTPGLRVAVGVHCETSTGMVNDIRGFAAATAPLVTVVDSASGAGACELRTDQWGIDVVVGGCQKALMTPPGLAFTSISERAWALHRQARLPRFYFDWTEAREALQAEVPRTPWTPAISLINQLDVALRQIHEEGMDNVLDRHVRLGRLARAGVHGLGLRLFSPDEDRHAAVTAVKLPADIDGDAFVNLLLERYGIQLTGSQGPLQGTVLRLGHCGFVDAFDVLTALAAIELGLAELGHTVAPGSGVAAAMQVLR
ncbi:pyridoxal-phosphate-dependent aminotransferase family protein [Streptomyces sp. NBC_01217]|uniref:pyridoxal-phosphate-dependent aminotransferase family protein n=1 Tax=Streptomyces sp. NBC_01217 TaxID=2903779 RepID=UPI002E1308F9|nr:alanine--glyoxylate aminotransferase family protein [Streptomyces sp. NBC_01217]